MPGEAGKRPTGRSPGLIQGLQESIAEPRVAGHEFTHAGQRQSREIKKGRCKAHLLFPSQNKSAQYRLKATSTFISTATAWPSFLAASNFQVFTPSMAFSSRPMPRERITLGP